MEHVLQPVRVPAERYAYFVQSLEDRFFEPDAPGERVLAAMTHALPVSFITEARWIADILAEMRPDAPCFLVRNGDRQGRVRAGRATGGTTHAAAAHPAWRAIRTCGSRVSARPPTCCASCASRTSRRSSRRPGATGTRRSARSAWSGRCRRRRWRAEYADTDVVLKLSRVEGMFGPPLEGFHMGATCVTTPVTGHDEFVEHGFNGLVTDWDDVRGTARALDLLARDRRLLHYLRTNAWLTARGWPGWQQSGDFMAAALSHDRDV